MLFTIFGGLHSNFNKFNQLCSANTLAISLFQLNSPTLFTSVAFSCLWKAYLNLYAQGE